MQDAGASPLLSTDYKLKGLFIIQIWAAVAFYASYLLLSHIRAAGVPVTIFCDDCDQLNDLDSEEKSKVLI